MNFFNDKTSSMLNLRMHWLSSRANVLTNNIALSDTKGAVRHEITPFKEILKKQKLSRTDSLKISEKDIVKTKNEISKELEMLELSRNTLEHDAIINTIKNLHQLMKTVININQGNG